MVIENSLGFKIQLYPTQEQKDIFKKYFGVSRYVYNYGISEVEKVYKETGLHIGGYELATRFVQFKSLKENSWLNDYDATMMKNTLFDVDRNYMKFFKIEGRRPPKFRKKKSTYQQFPIRVERMSIYKTYVRIPGIKTNIACGYISNPKCIGKGYLPKTSAEYRKYIDARIVYNGLHYYLCFRMDVSNDLLPSSVEKYREINQGKPSIGVIGIDFGFSKNNWLVDNNGNRVSLPDKTKEDKKIRHFFRKMHRQLRTSKSKKRSKNLDKTIETLNKYYKRISNKRLSLVHDYISHEIIERKPLAVVIEDIKASDMYNLKLKGFQKKMNIENINSHIPATFQSIIKYKCETNGIPLVKAERGFPSTKRCSSCGHIQDMGRKKVYRCPVCGMVMDRDYNAAINLSHYMNISHMESNNLI